MQFHGGPFAARLFSAESQASRPHELDAELEQQGRSLRPAIGRGRSLYQQGHVGLREPIALEPTSKANAGARVDRTGRESGLDVTFVS